MTIQPGMQRLRWMDALRGAVILLVIVYHSYGRSLYAEGPPAFVVLLDRFVEPLRMPTMVFLSGMLVERSLRKGTRAYVAGKVRNILHPYLVWSVIMIVIIVWVQVDAPLEPGLLLAVLARPIWHLWFLWFLMAYFGVALVTRRLPALAVAAAFWTMGAGLTWLTGHDKELAYLGAFFMVGVYAGRSPDRFWSVAGSRGVTVALAVVLPVIAVLAAAGVSLRYRAETLPVVLVAVVGTCAWASRSRWLAQQPFLGYLGRESLVFYLSHLPVLLILDAYIFDYLSPAASMAVGVAASLVAGTVLAWASRRSFAAALLFRWPAPRTANPSVRAVVAREQPHLR